MICIMPSITITLRLCLIGGILIFSLQQPAVSQDLQAEAQKLKNLTKLPSQVLQEGIKVSGGVNTLSTFYTTNAVESTGRLPFESILSGNINFDFYGKIKMPFTFTLNSQNINFKSPFDERLRFQNPFNRFQFKPTYKGLTVLMGVNSMTFSPYTLNGHRFDGVGVQFKPKQKPFYASFMWGTLQKAVFRDTSGLTRNNNPAYQRKSWGFQLGYKSKDYLGEISLLRSRDDISSLPYTIDDFAYPEANVAVGFKGSALLQKKWTLSMDLSMSGLTKDIRNTINEPPSDNFSFGGLLQTNRSTIIKKALKTGLKYGGKSFQTALEYTRVDPEYKTHGAYYFVNDLENVALSTTSNWLKNRLNIAVSIGRQHNNLAESANLQTLWQWVGSTNISFIPSDKTMLNLTYSTFQSYTNLRTDMEYLTTISTYAGLDTLNYRQINQNLQLMFVKKLPRATKEHPQVLQVQGLYQGSSNQQGSLTRRTQVNTLNLVYNNQLIAQKRNYSVALNINRNDLVVRSEWFVGPSFTYQKALLNQKIQLQSALNYLKTIRSTEQSGDVLNARFTLGFQPSKEHQFNLSLLSMYRNLSPGKIIERNFWDMTLTLGYQYQFQTKFGAITPKTNPK